ncbi:MAG: hypothetical protein K2X97_08880 [Mycobacteriaceae bacterium]|nr:hypothetical protein [Mycobacteriaceae bacterium]
MLSTQQASGARVSQEIGPAQRNQQLAQARLTQVTFELADILRKVWPY